MKTNELDDARSFYDDSLGRKEWGVQFDFDAPDRVALEKW